jgi:hypothetical protein
MEVEREIKKLFLRETPGLAPGSSTAAEEAAACRVRSSLDLSRIDSANRWSGLRWFRNEMSPPTPIRILEKIKTIIFLIFLLNVQFLRKTMYDL